MSDQPRRPGESALIAHYFAPLCKDDAAFGLTDDAAFLPMSDGQQLVLTKDMLVADIHFFADDQPDFIAAKALRVNLSDLAAKGAKPLGYLLGLGLPTNWTEEWLAQFCKGLKRNQDEFDFPLLGGDTAKSPDRLTLSITAFGTIAQDRLVLRKNATPGDGLYVSGTIGDGALGLATRQGRYASILSPEHHDYLTDRFLMPRPRMALREVIARFASAGMDISDGLLGDAAKMAKAANVALLIDQSLIPVSEAAQQLVKHDLRLWDVIISGGDDYELLFAVPQKYETTAEHMARDAGIPIKRIGSVVEGAGVILRNLKDDVRVIDDKGAYEHF